MHSSPRPLEIFHALLAPPPPIRMETPLPSVMDQAALKPFEPCRVRYFMDRGLIVLGDMILHAVRMQRLTPLKKRRRITSRTGMPTQEHESYSPTGPDKQGSVAVSVVYWDFRSQKCWMHLLELLARSPGYPTLLHICNSPKPPNDLYTLPVEFQRKH